MGTDARDNAGLEQMLDLVHDRWVDLDEMTCDFVHRCIAFRVFDSAAGEVRILSSFPVEIVCTVDDLRVEFTLVGEAPAS